MLGQHFQVKLTVDCVNNILCIAVEVARCHNRTVQTKRRAVEESTLCTLFRACNGGARCGYRLTAIGLYRDVWIAAIASSTTSLATRTAAICVRFQGRRVHRVYVTMQITFLTRKSALGSTSESRQPHSQWQWRIRDKSLC